MINGRKGRAKDLARVRKRQLAEAEAAGVDMNDRAAIKAFQDAKFNDLVQRYTKRTPVQ